MHERAGSPSPAQTQAESLAGVGRWRLDLRTGELTTNAAARAMLGRPDGPAPQLADFLDAVHPGDRQRLTALTDRLVSTGEPYLLEHRVLLPGGRMMHHRASGCAEVDEHGRPTVLHGVTLDVTDLQQALTETAREGDRNRAVLRSLTDGYFLAADGVLLEVNEALCRLTGFSERELVGAGTPYPFWPPGQTDDLLERRAQLMRQGGGTAEMEIVRKDGTRLPVAFTATGLTPTDRRALWVVLMRDITVERAHARELELRAATDPLTGVRNSRAFREELRDQVALARAGGTPLSLALVDVDHFKAVNDEHGHAVGDEVLVAVVERLLAVTAGRGVLARVGGEEFALLVPGADEAAGRALLGEALAALRGSPITSVGTVTASAGVAQLRDDDDEGRLYRRADALMYEAKDRGRDQVR